MKPTYLSWSGGKDATLALDSLKNNPRYHIAGLLTTANDHYGRVSMHGLRMELVEEQAEKLGLPLEVVRLPKEVDYDIYEREMKRSMNKLSSEGIEAIAFGDIFLEDLKKYREQMLSACGLEGVYPLWEQDTRELSNYFINKGYRSKVIVINGTKLEDAYVGREYDASFLNDLPDGIDPCGENGEFHSFVYDGPLFSQAVTFKTGEVQVRHYGGEESNRAVFCDVIPG